MPKRGNSFRRVLRFTYWRLIWAQNVVKAIFRYIRNHAIAGLRFLRNYLALIYRLLYLGILELLMKLSGLFRNKYKISRNPKISLDRFDYLTFQEGLLDIRNQLTRFIYRKRIEHNSNAKQLESLISNHWHLLTLNKLTDGKGPVLIDATLIFHIYYSDIAIEMIDKIKNKKILFKDVIVTYTNSELTEIITNLISPISANAPKLFLTKNYLRDVAPFLLASMQYSPQGTVIKLHTKKSPHLNSTTATQWRNSLLDGLLPSIDSVIEIDNVLKRQSVPALYCPAQWLSEPKQWGRNSRFIFEMCLELEIPYQKYAPFPMGTMFWCNSLMLDQLQKVKIPQESPVFSERGLMDGTWPHAFERLPGQIVLAHGVGFKS